jgi:hypothetical protein
MEGSIHRALLNSTSNAMDSEPEERRSLRDVLLMIFEQLSQKDRFAASLVCRQWTETAQELIWTRVQVGSSQLDAFVLAVASKKDRGEVLHIKELRISGVGPDHAVFGAVSGNLNNASRLRTLAISSDSGPSTEASEGLRSLVLQPGLETLELAGNIMDDGLLSKVFQTNNSLSSLAIRNNTILTIEGATTAISTSNIHLCSLDGTGTPAIHSAPFLEHLSKSSISSGLRTLVLIGEDDAPNSTHLDETGLAALSLLPNIVSLTLGAQPKLTSHYIRLILSNMPLLEELFLGHSFWLKDLDLDFIVEKCPRLRKLALRRILGIATPSLTRAVVVLREQLEELDVAGTSSNVLFCLDVVRMCPNLRKLAFRKVTEMGMRLGLETGLNDLTAEAARRNVALEVVDF